MRHFMPGRFSSRGIVKLAQTNGIAQYVCSQAFGTVPLMVHPTTARSFMGIVHGRLKSGRNEKIPVKEKVLAFVLDHGVDVDAIAGNSPARFDVTDAFIIAWYRRAAH